MRKTLGMNKHQKAARKPGEEKVSRAEIDDLLVMSCSVEVDDRLTAAKYLCPCHIQARIPAVWEAVFRMMEDPEPKVRVAAWHTWEDGGLPSDPTALAQMEAIYAREQNPKVRRFASSLLGATLAERQQQELTRMHQATKPVGQRGKCDFCGKSNVIVTRDLETTIPTAGIPRAAWICANCQV